MSNSQTATELSEKRRIAGRLGGLQTALRYSKEQRREWGKRGGRPRLPTLAELRQQSVPVSNENNRRMAANSSNNLRTLRDEKHSLHAQIAEMGEQIHRLESIRCCKELHLRGLKAHLNTVREAIKCIRRG